MCDATLQPLEAACLGDVRLIITLWPSGRMLVTPEGAAFFAYLAFRWLGRRRRLVRFVFCGVRLQCSTTRDGSGAAREQVIHRAEKLLRVFIRRAGQDAAIRCGNPVREHLFRIVAWYREQVSTQRC